ncbi:MAG: GspE/PulE family protein [Arcobacteraceae bacterium]|jgi:general secretion pathway protein E|nr:GspE/PulE family protein [Arcobacteraceae bacterium]
MLTKELIHNLDLLPKNREGYQLALKNYVLFSTIDEKDVVVVCEEHLAVAFDFISKQEFNEDVVLVDELSYERLYNRFIELRADLQMSELASSKQSEMENEEDISLTEFLKTSSDILTSEESAPIIKFVNSLFYQAIKKKASDIHIELHEHKGEIRYRIDGVLIKHIELDKKIMALIISRIKIISELDISEKRIPQDGRTSIKLSGRTLDIRVSVLPTFYGERVTMRILMQSEDIPTLENLGISPAIKDKLHELSQNSHGMILVTGPTGSGKSTTLHSLLQKIEDPNKNIITVEDPVEYKSDKINQIQVNNKVGLTFASGLRSILRQDPDIIMVGEIRDSETAQIATQAALTGHLVLSTLHTNRAHSAINRLVDMGLERFLISSALLGVMAQRLVRKLCDECKCEDEIAEIHLPKFEMDENTKVYKAVGCKRCNFTGYAGREAIAELFLINKEVITALKNDVDDSELENIALKDGMVPLKMQLKEMITQGTTSLDEALRIGLH